MLRNQGVYISISAMFCSELEDVDADGSDNDSDGSKNGGLWQGFKNGCLGAAALIGSFSPSMKDSDGSKNGGLWQEFRNVCFTEADCKGSFFPSMKDEVNDSITKRRTVQDDSIIAQLGFSWLKMKCGVELERFDGNGLQCALL